MPAWFGRHRDAKPTIESLRFDAAGWVYHGEREAGQTRVWETPDHDAVSLHLFNIAPDLPAAKTVQQLRDFYVAQLGASKAKILECGVVNVAKTKAVWLLIKAPQQPTGMMYQGVFTLPFRDFSFVIKIQSPELGTTGMREAVLTERRLKAGEQPNTTGTGPIFPGWNPDSPEFDAEFPSHPLSRLRRLQQRILRCASLDESIGRSPSFPLPGGG